MCIKLYNFMFTANNPKTSNTIINKYKWNNQSS